MHQILEPGKNCEGIYPVSKTGLLVDGSSYYNAFYEVASRARRYILMAGWQFDSDVQLLRGETAHSDGKEVRLLPFLNTLCDRNEDIEIYILAWDFSALFAYDREWFQEWIFDWTTNDRLHFIFDDRHAIGASHHQKFAVIDGAAAFVGGMDICSHRWDDRKHLAYNPERIDTYGKPYEPYHDIHSYHVGPAALRIKELFQTRWKKAGGGNLKLSDVPGEHLPDISLSIPVDAEYVAISRTQSRTFMPYQENIREVRQLYLDAIHAAQKLIYMENQYFSSQAVYRALVERMRESLLPKLNIIMILPQKPHSLLEEVSMGIIHIKMLRSLRDIASQYGHYLGIYCTLAHSSDDDEHSKATYIHAKLLLVDDRFLTIGSANTSNRSMGLDTELNVAWEATGESADDLIVSITRARMNLLAEHAGINKDTISQRLSQNDNPVIYLNTIAKPGESRLRPYSTETFIEDSQWLYSVVPEDISIDPEEPIIEENFFELLSRDGTGIFAEGITRLSDLLSRQSEKTGPSGFQTVSRLKRTRRLKIVILFILAAMILMTWITGIHEDITFENLKEKRDILNEFVSDNYFVSSIIFIVIFMLTAFFVPGAIVMTIAAGAFFGVIRGAIYVNIGGTSGALITFLLSRYFAGNWVQKKYGHYLKKFNKEMSRHGYNYLLTVRIIPVAPFFLINFLAALTSIRTWTFFWTTMIGMLPGSLVYTFAGQQIVAIESVSDIMSLKLIIAFVLMGFFILLPVFKHHVTRLKR